MWSERISVNWSVCSPFRFGRCPIQWERGWGGGGQKFRPVHFSKLEVFVRVLEVEAVEVTVQPHQGLLSRFSCPCPCVAYYSDSRGSESESSWNIIKPLKLLSNNSFVSMVHGNSLRYGNLLVLQGKQFTYVVPRLWRKTLTYTRLQQDWAANSRAYPCTQHLCVLPPREQHRTRG